MYNCERKVFMEQLEKCLKKKNKHLTTKQFQAAFFIAKIFLERGEEIAPNVYQSKISGNALAKELESNISWINNIIRMLVECQVMQRKGTLHSRNIIHVFDFNVLEEE